MPHAKRPHQRRSDHSHIMPSALCQRRDSKRLRASLQDDPSGWPSLQEGDESVRSANAIRRRSLHQPRGYRLGCPCFPCQSRCAPLISPLCRPVSATARKAAHFIFSDQAHATSTRNNRTVCAARQERRQERGINRIYGYEQLSFRASMAVLQREWIRRDRRKSHGTRSRDFDHHRGSASNLKVRPILCCGTKRTSVRWTCAQWPSPGRCACG